MSGEIKTILKIKEKLNSISPSFCLAKWMQTTIHLQNGFTHSCHHTPIHKITPDDIKNNPSGLHNTKEKINQRKNMLEGIRGKECFYCWSIEDASEENVSDRYIKSSQHWAQNNLDKVLDNPLSNTISPSYLEISFSNVCNLRCVYCSPTFSSKWHNEIKKLGPYKDSNNYNNLEYLKERKMLPIPYKEKNMYVDAFWEWWPTLVDTLEVFRITGGEPLLDENVYKIIEYLKNNKKPNLELNINSNLFVKSTTLEQVVKDLVFLEKNGCVKSIKIYTSMDTYGEHGEYLRTGINYNTWFKNVNYILSNTKRVKVVVMNTINLLSLDKLVFLLADIYNLKMKFFNEERKVPVTINSSILHHPEFLSVLLLEQDYFMYKINEILKFMKYRQEGEFDNPYYKGFFDFEITCFKRLKNYYKENKENSSFKEKEKNLKMWFLNFVTENDKRTGTDFNKTFKNYNIML